MKLAKIDHYRCDDWAAATYVWLTESMTQDEFEALCLQAREAYLKAEEDLKNDPTAPPNPGYRPQYEKFPSFTVAQIEEEHEKQKVIYKIWEDKRKAARKTFAEHLKAIGNGEVESFYNVTPELLNAIHWGHRHGQTIEYGRTTINSDFPNAPKFSTSSIGEDDEEL